MGKLSLLTTLDLSNAGNITVTFQLPLAFLTYLKNEIIAKVYGYIILGHSSHGNAVHTVALAVSVSAQRRIPQWHHRLLQQ
jgi:hypothetical protein